MNPTPKFTPPERDARSGFALLVTVVLVAFLVLILVGLATLTRVETQVAGNSQNLAPPPASHPESGAHLLS